MDKDDDAYVQAAASVFSTVECQILDHHLSLPLKLQDSPTKPGSNCSGAHVITESNGHHHHHQQQQQQTYGSDLMGKFFLDSMNMGLQPPSKAFNGNSDKDEELQEQAGFDPICFLKLPLQKITAKGDNPFVDFRLSTYNHPEEGDGIAPSEVTNSYQTCRNTVNSPPNQGEDDYNSADYDDNTTTHPHPNHHLSISASDQELTGFNPQANCNDMVMGMTHNKERKKRSRTCKSSEEVESQRMTHIAVERNRRKQMNEHLRVLRQLMPGSYVQRGDQASIIGGAIEFVKELEQLLQCLESQKRRRMYADYQHYLQMTQLPTNNNATTTPLLPMPECPTRDDVADLKSPVADVEVKLMGLDAVIKILSQRRPGQLLKTISALQNNLRFSILHTNITTIEHTVLYSFNVKVSIDQRSTAEEIATSIQHIFSMIHASSINT